MADEDGRPLHSWRVALLPYVSDLHKEYDFAQPWDGPHNRDLAARMPPVYAFHSERQPGITITNFVAVVGAETVWPGATTLTEKDVTDGASNTILIVENAGGRIPWMAPRDLSFDAMTFKLNVATEIGSKYVDPAVALLDTRVLRLHADISPATLRALLTVRGDEKLTEGEDGWSVIEDGRDREVRK